MSKPKPASQATRTVKPSEAAALRTKAVSVGGFDDPAAASISKARPVDEFPDIADILPDMAAESRALADQIEELDRRRKEINKDIGMLLEAVEHDSIKGDGWLAVRVKGQSTTLKKELLLAEGVSIQTIERCTVKGNEYYYVQVRDPKKGMKGLS